MKHNHTVNCRSNKACFPLFLHLDIPNPGVTAEAERADGNFQTRWGRCHSPGYPCDWQPIHFLLIVLYKSPHNNLLDLIHGWGKCKTGITEPIFLRRSRHRGVSSWNPTVAWQFHKLHWDNLSIHHWITAPSFSKAAGDWSDWSQLTMHVQAQHKLAVFS